MDDSVLEGGLKHNQLVVLAKTNGQYLIGKFVVPTTPNIDDSENEDVDEDADEDESYYGGDDLDLSEEKDSGVGFVDELWIDHPMFVQHGNNASGQLVIGLTPYVPPFVIQPRDTLIPIPRDVVEAIYYPAPQLEALWVKATSGIEIASANSISLARN